MTFYIYLFEMSKKSSPYEKIPSKIIINIQILQKQYVYSNP